MVSYKIAYIPGKLLSCGYRAKDVHFSHKSRDERLPHKIEEFDRIVVSVWRFGIRNPLIVYKNNILVGMSRYEIMMRWNPEYIFKCWSVLEDVDSWNRLDLDRLQALKESYDKIEDFKEIWDRTGELAPPGVMRRMG